MSDVVEHVAGTTFHGRRGAIRNAFRYRVDYVLLDAERPQRAPRLFARNRRGLFALQDRDHGGPPGAGEGAAWVRRVLAGEGIALAGPILLLAQPRVLGHVFNPVSFWLCHDGPGVLRCVIAEVTNTFGDRHSYLCHHDGLEPITAAGRVAARKVFHVSPFMEVSGTYSFRFNITPDEIDIRIDYRDGEGGLVATLQGRRRPLTTGALIAAALRRPLGSRRVLALIHWQALKLWWKGAAYHPRPAPPAEEVSR